MIWTLILLSPLAILGAIALLAAPLALDVRRGLKNWE